MSESFKTCMFGGFNKQDVVDFIEEQSRAYREELESLQRDNAVLKEAVQRMESERGEFLPKAQQQEEAAARMEELERQLSQLCAEAATLREENEKLRGPAREYENLKDHIAEIEINAHRRTEEFRIETVRKMRDIINAQRAWCGEERGRYHTINAETLQKLRQATEMMESDSDAGFDRMLESLQQLEDSLE